MANILGLALKISADSTQLKLTPAERALQSLGAEAEKVGKVFERFAGTTAAAAEAQQRTAARFAELDARLKAQTITAQEYAASFAAIKAETTALAAVFERGAQTAARFATDQEKSAAAISKFAEELRVGATEAPVFERALQSLVNVDLSGTEEGRRALAELAQQARDGTLDFNAAAATLQGLADRQETYTAAQSRAAQLVGTLATEEQKRSAQAAEYNTLLQQGLISEEQRAALLQRLGPITDAARQAEAALATDRQQARQIIESLVTPQERYQQSVADLDRLLGQNLINQEQYNRALQQAQTALDNASGASADAAEAEARRVASQREGAAITASVQTAEERRAERLDRLDQLLEEGAISEQTYGRAVEQASAARETAARVEAERTRVLQEGRRLTEQFATVEERRAEQLANLERLLAAGAISQETFQRASLEASGANEAAARAERERADALAAASRIIQANITPQERYDAAIVELQGHLDAGRLSQEQFNRAVARAREGLDRTTTSARSNDTALQGITKQLRLISAIEIGRAVVDVFQLLGGFARNAASQLTNLAASATQSLDSLNDLGNRIDVGVEQLQTLGLAAKLSGVDTEQFATAVTRLGVQIGKADQGGQFDRTLKSIGVTLAELRGLRPEEQFAQISAAIGSLPTSADRAAAAVEIFGKQGAALTPLFQAGAASLEELTARAERLGIVVSQDQVSNIGDMNDAFDLVGATVEGIIGQVSGNLAPLVTAISQEFLAFVETFTGANGSGGAAIADAITDSLLSGAEVLAGVFDRSVEQFAGFAETLGTVGEVFSRASSVLSSVVNAAQALFNLGQSIVSLVTVGIGKVLEQLGRIPFLADLGETGRALADAAFAELEKNADEFKNAVDRSIASAGDAIFGETPAESGERGAGAAESYITQFRSKIEEARSPEFRVNSNIEATRDAFDDFFGGVIDQSSRVTGLMRDFEAAVAAAQEDATLTADEIARIEDLQKRVNSAIQQELAARSDAAESARKQADEDTKRIDSLLRTSDATQKIIDDLSAVEREVARVQQEIASAAAGDDGTARARLDGLRLLQGQLEDQLQAAAQGFEQGFDKAFAATGGNFSRLAEQAAQFGDAGNAAAVRLQEGIAAAQEQARDGILNREAFEAEVARQQRLFEQELANVKAVADERAKVNELVDQRFLLARFGGDQQRLAAAQNLAQLEREIGRVQADVQAARAAGNQEEVNAGIARLGQLDQVAAQERDIASGRRQLEQQLGQQREQYLKQLEQQQQQAQQAQQKYLEEQAKAVEAENQRQVARIRELNTLGSGVIQGNDIRTAEGAALFLNLAANQQDPALIEARLQTRRLTELRDTLVAISAQFAGPVVQIGGGVG
jgi:hypothetical protein